MKLTLITAALLAATGLVQAQSATYALEPTHSFVNYEVRHFGTSTSRGRFEKKEGTITIDRTAKTGKAEISIETGSISTGVAPLDTHLKSKDFLNAAEFPTAKFVGDKFSFDANNKVTAVAGTFTMAGKTHPVTLTATNFNCYESPMLKREVCGGDFEGTIQRSLFGSTYGLPGIPDNVRLLIQVEAVKQ
jgi:polyisoprenoid-binding protein YceI